MYRIEERDFGDFKVFTGIIEDHDGNEDEICSDPDRSVVVLAMIDEADRRMNHWDNLSLLLKREIK